MSRDDAVRALSGFRRKRRAGAPMTATRRSVLAGLMGASVSSDIRAQAPILIETSVTEAVARPYGDGLPGSTAVGFDGRFAAPPLRLKRGVPVTIALRNELDRPFAPFVHGLRGASAFAGVPGLTRAAMLAPGAVDVATFTPREAGTFLLRPFGDDALQRAGFARVVIVEEAEPVDADQDVVLLLHDVPKGVSVPAGVDAQRDILVNGERPPLRIQAPDGSRLRLRVVNASTRDGDDTGIRNGTIPLGSPRAVEIARDGTPLLDSWTSPSGGVVCRPGQRAELWYEVPPPRDPRLPSRAHDGVFRVEPPEDAQARAPQRAAQATLPALPTNGPRPRLDLARALRVDIPITEAAGRVRMAGRTGDAFRLPALFRVAAGRTVVLRIEARRPWGALLHLQGHAAYVLDAMDDGVQPWLLDTIDVPRERVVTVAFRASERGRHYFGAVSQADIERGLAAWYEVI